MIKASRKTAGVIPGYLVPVIMIISKVIQNIFYLSSTLLWPLRRKEELLLLQWYVVNVKLRTTLQASIKLQLQSLLRQNTASTVKNTQNTLQRKN